MEAKIIKKSSKIPEALRKGVQVDKIKAAKAINDELAAKEKEAEALEKEIVEDSMVEIKKFSSDVEGIYNIAKKLIGGKEGDIYLTWVSFRAG